MYTYMKSSDAKASKCHSKFSSLMMIFYQACIFKLIWQKKKKCFDY